MSKKPPHKHDTCNNPVGGTVCTGGYLTGYCDFEGCTNEYCVNEGHCGCKCHSGKTCICENFTWPKMERSRSKAMKE